GVPFWLPLPVAPEWRWLWGRDDSPWYPTARVFRQDRPGDWDGVFARMAEALRSQDPAPVEAAPNHRRAAEPVTTTAVPPMALGWQCYLAADWAGAEQAFRSTLQTEPDNADAWCFLGIVCRARGDLTQAAGSYREAVRLRPAFTEAHNNLGNVLVLQGQ